MAAQPKARCHLSLNPSSVCPVGTRPWEVPREGEKEEGKQKREKGPCGEGGEQMVVGEHLVLHHLCSSSGAFSVSLVF